MYSSTTRTGAGLTVGPVGQQLTTAYGGTIAFEHGWNAEWRTSVFGGAEVLDYNSTANAILCSRFAAGSASGTLTNLAGVNVSNTDACNFDYRVVGAGTRTYWTPVRDLTIGVEFQWSKSSREPRRRHGLQSTGDLRLQAQCGLRGPRSERVLGSVLGAPRLLIAAAA